MTNVDTLPLLSDDAAPVNPFAAYREHFEQRRMTVLDCPPQDQQVVYFAALARWIELQTERIAAKRAAKPETPLAKAGTTMPTVTNDARRHLATDNTYPNQGRNQTVTQRVLSFNLTSDKATGVGRWEVITRDANGSHTNRFKEADPVASQLFTRWVPFDRNQIVHLDSAWDLTWKNVDGWAAAVSFEEVTDMPTEPITAPLKNAAERKKAKEAKSEMEQHFEKVECPTCHGDGNEEGNPNKACPECFGEGWVYKSDSQPAPAPVKDYAAWVDDDKARGKFFADYDSLCNKYLVEASNRDPLRKAYLMRTTGKDSLKGWRKTADVLLAELEIDLRRAGYKMLDQATLTAKLVEQLVAENQPEVKSTPSNNGNGDKPSNSPAIASEVSMQENTSADTAPAISDGKTLPENGNGKVAGEIKPEFTPSPLLSEVKTLMGVPVGQIPEVLNRKHHKAYYDKIDAKDKDSAFWTDLDPIGVRKRFDKVFGPHGFGWRIVPLQGMGSVSVVDTMQKTKSGERSVTVVTMQAFVFEYALVVNGQVQYTQTSAFSDSNMNADKGDACRGAFTSLMKQALKMFGGFDHFMDKALAS